jgi:hypothetical protein
MKTSEQFENFFKINVFGTHEKPTKESLSIF